MHPLAGSMHCRVLGPRIHTRTQNDFFYFERNAFRQSNAASSSSQPAKSLSFYYIFLILKKFTHLKISSIYKTIDGSSHLYIDSVPIFSQAREPAKVIQSTQQGTGNHRAALQLFKKFSHPNTFNFSSTAPLPKT